jgi:hypothetical protein
MSRTSTEHAAECLYRINEFRLWVQSNVLFPLVPDSIVAPLRVQLLAAEHVLVGILYDAEQLDAVTAVLKATAVPPLRSALSEPP